VQRALDAQVAQTRQADRRYTWGHVARQRTGATPRPSRGGHLAPSLSLTYPSSVRLFAYPSRKRDE
jgi:hypothetical protein